MRVEEVSLESIAIEPEGGHKGTAVYDTVLFRVFDRGHPNSFVVPVSVNTDQYPAEEIEGHARFVFHRLMKAVAEATKDWDRLDPRPLA